TVRITSRVGSGAAHARPGLVGLMNEALIKGTRSRSVEAIGRVIGTHGANVSMATTWDYSEVTLTVDSRRLEPVLKVVSDAVVHPALPAPRGGALLPDRS